MRTYFILLFNFLQNPLSGHGINAYIACCEKKFVNLITHSSIRPSGLLKFSCEHCPPILLESRRDAFSVLRLVFDWFSWFYWVLNAAYLGWLFSWFQDASVSLFYTSTIIIIAVALLYLI